MAIRTFQLEEYVKVSATGSVGRIEQWTEEPNKYWVEFNRDFSTRKWFAPDELERAEEPPSIQEAGYPRSSWEATTADASDQRASGPCGGFFSILVQESLSGRVRLKTRLPEVYSGSRQK
jgi:hypothetical protein